MVSTSAVSVPQERAGYSAVQGDQVSGPITPSAGRLLAFWKLRTALVVLLPNRPSAFRAAPLRYELALGALDRRARLAALDGDAGIALVADVGGGKFGVQGVPGQGAHLAVGLQVVAQLELLHGFGGVGAEPAVHRLRVKVGAGSREPFSQVWIRAVSGPADPLLDAA